MANHKSALKRNRQNIKKNERNSAIKTNLRRSVKKLREDIAGNDKEKAIAGLKEVTVKLDKAVTKNILHKNNAARKVSRLTKQVNGL